MTFSNRLTVADAFNAFQDELLLSWVQGTDDGERLISSERAAGERPRLIGPLSFNSANRIQLVGRAEVRLFSQLDSLATERFEYSLQDSCELFVITDGQTPPASVVALAESASIPVFISALPYSECQKTLRHRLTQRLADREIIHGVMMDVNGTGVLITGDAKVGKSELALELISRGHTLVADDAPEFRRIAPGTLECTCPPLLQDFLEVRGLGILNIARMYGDAHTRSRKVLRFIVHLQVVRQKPANVSDDSNTEDRLAGPHAAREILAVSIPQRTIPVAPGRNLAVLIEAAVRDYILRSGGYSAVHDLVDKQSQAIAQS